MKASKSMLLTLLVIGLLLSITSCGKNIESDIEKGKSLVTKLHYAFVQQQKSDYSPKYEKEMVSAAENVNSFKEKMKAKYSDSEYLRIETELDIELDRLAKQ